MSEKKSRKFERLHAVADAVCRGEEERYARQQQQLAAARARAERLQSLAGKPGSLMTLLPEMWCSHLSKTHAEIASLDQEASILADRVHVARLRRDKVEESLRHERGRERSEKRDQDVADHVELSIQFDRIRFR